MTPLTTPTRPPFTLTPLPGEAFDSWLEAYAARLHVSTAELAGALGLPQGTSRIPVRLLTRGGSHPAQLATVASQTGLDPATVAGMFFAPAYQLTPSSSPNPPAAESIRRAWSPAPGTRFCPACLAHSNGRFMLAWRLPWTFWCLDHNQPLAEACPRCGRPPRVRLPTTPQPAGARRCTAPARAPARTRPTTACNADLAAAAAPAPSNPQAAAGAQRFINRLLAQLHAGNASPQRQAAIDALTDLSVIVLHLADPGRYGATPRRVLARMLRADTLTDAVALLTASRDGDPTADPLAALVHRHAASPKARAVPQSWRTASPALTARISHRRDAAMTVIERLRHASTLPTPIPKSNPDSPLDPAITRARRLPDQLWSVWAVRLLGDDTLDPTLFRHAAAVALLLPHSNLLLGNATGLFSDQVGYHTVEHQLRVLAKTPAGTAALRILTELSLAIDRHDLPIDYAHRRQLAASIDLIDVATWKRLARQFHHFQGGHRRHGFARRYLYELLTAGNLAIAPSPYTLPQGLLRFEYHDFVLALPAGLVAALAEHATRLLTQAGITDEPLQWHPPAGWVTVRHWPGVDPDHTDPAPIHQALLAGTPPSHVAKRLGLSTEHLRYVVRRHPLPDTTPRIPRGAVILPRPAGPAAAQPPHPPRPGVHYVDLTWLHDQYVTWKRPLGDIANEIGCKKSTLRNFAIKHHIPPRPASGGTTCFFHGAAPVHPAHLPDLLRHALTGPRARQRLDRFLRIAECRTLNQAADRLGCCPSTLSTQLATLERRCGGQLIRRIGRRLGDLTPLGQQLQQQAHHYLAPPHPEPS
jgi:hypothetical protein